MKQSLHVTSNAIQGAINSKKDAGYLASTAYRQLLQADNIAATSSQGSEQSLSNITLADVKAFYQQQVKPANSQLIVVSDLKEKAVVKSLTFFQHGKVKVRAWCCHLLSLIQKPALFI